MDCESYRDQMLDVLYGEADGESARRVEEHQSACQGCREEMAGLRQVRRDLRAWTLPAAPVALRPPPAAFRPRHALAVAAGLLMATGAALGFSGSELRYQDGRVAFRLGRASAAPDVAALLAAQEARFRRELQALGAAPAAATAAAPMPAAPAPAPAALDAAVRRLVEDSEARQAAILNTSLSDLEDRLTEQQRAYMKVTRTMMAMVDNRMAVVDTRASLNAARCAQQVALAFPVSEQK